MSPIQTEQEKEPEEIVLPSCAWLAGDNGSWARGEAESQPSPGSLSVFSGGGTWPRGTQGRMRLGPLPD